MFKRITTGIVCLLAIVSLMLPCLTASARASEVEFALSATDGAVGDTITVTVSISEDSYFTNATLHLYYDAALVSFVEESTGSISPSNGSMFMVSDNPDKGEIVGAYVTVNGIKKGGDLITFDFKVEKLATAVFSLSFSECVGVDENNTEFDVNYITYGCVANKTGNSTVEVPAYSSNGTTSKVPATTTKAAVTTSAPAVTAVSSATNATAQTTAATDEAGHTVTVSPDSQDTATTTADSATTEAAASAQETAQTSSSADESDDGNGAATLVVVLIGVAIAIAVAAVAIFMRKKRMAQTDDASQPDGTDQE